MQQLTHRTPERGAPHRLAHGMNTDTGRRGEQPDALEDLPGPNVAHVRIGAGADDAAPGGTLYDLMVLPGDRLADVHVRDSESAESGQRLRRPENPLANPLRQFFPERRIGELEPVGFEGQLVDPAAEALVGA